MNFGGSWAASQPKSALILKCHFAEGEDPWLWFKLPPQMVLAKPRNWDYLIISFVMEMPSRREFFTQSLGVQVQRAALIHSSAPIWV